MQLKADEIAAILERELAGYEADVDLAEVGTVLDGRRRHRPHLRPREGAWRASCSPSRNDVYGLALNLEEDEVGAVLMGETAPVEEGDQVRRTGRIMQVPVGDALIGRVVNPLGGRSTARGRSRRPITTRSSASPPASSIASR